MIGAIFDLMKAICRTKAQEERQNEAITKQIVTNKIGNHITQKEHDELLKKVLKIRF